ncbi:MAG: hypothetical protein K9J13_01405 [Saprospiraceae bacterium]|nr:hypothetical protein [Saprospiraceae bacterium]
MLKQQNKIIVFSIGLLAGVIICFGIFWIFINNNDNSNGKVAMSTDETIDVYSNKNDSKLNAKYKPSKYKIPKKVKNDKLNNDSLLEELTEDSLMFDSIDRNTEISDSLPLINAKAYGNDDIVVMKDEMIFVRKIQPLGESLQKDDDKNLDSLLVDNNLNNKKILSYRVEFWKSPINYKGYKMDNDKIVLFGIYEYDNVKLRWKNEVLFLDYRDKTYRLKEAPGFEPLVPIQNKDK